MVSRMLLLLCCVQAGIGTVTDNDLKKKLGINPAALKKVSWKDWINKNNLVSWGSRGAARQCQSDITGLNGCCNRDEDCGKSAALACYDNNGDPKICDCNRKRSYFINERETFCILRTKRNLEESCTPQSHCYAAYAICKGGRCVCRDGFYQYNGSCYPKSYGCPYGRPLAASGYLKIKTCQPSRKSSCPDGYFCLEIQRSDYVFNRDLSNYEGYCCPFMPDVKPPTKERDSEGRLKKQAFDDVCFFGKPFDTSSGPCPDDHYISKGIGVGEVCCPSPCIPEPVIIRNGKCEFL